MNGQRAIGSEFRRSILWQKAQTFAADITTLVRDLPRDRAADAIGTQLMRSGASIAANIAEGYGRFSQAAYRSHLSIARGSAFETESWLDLLERQNYIATDVATALIAQGTKLQKPITARMKTLNAGKTYALKEDLVRYGAN